MINIFIRDIMLFIIATVSLIAKVIGKILLIPLALVLVPLTFILIKKEELENRYEGNSK